MGLRVVQEGKGVVYIRAGEDTTSHLKKNLNECRLKKKKTQTVAVIACIEYPSPLRPQEDR